MADRTIIQYFTGTPAQSGDITIIQRGGQYFGVTTDSVAALTPPGVSTNLNALYVLGWSGTNGANFGIYLASQGTNGVNQVLAIANQGTHLDAFGGTINGPLTVTGTVTVDGKLFGQSTAVFAGSLTVNLGGTFGGPVNAPNFQVGTGTVPTSSAVAGTIYYDFAGAAYQQTTADVSFYLSGKNLGVGREIAVILQSNGTTQNITFPSTFTWYGTSPTTVGAKNVLIALTSLTTSLTGVIGAVSVAI